MRISPTSGKEAAEVAECVLVITSDSIPSVKCFQWHGTASVGVAPVKHLLSPVRRTKLVSRSSPFHLFFILTEIQWRLINITLMRPIIMDYF